LALIFINGSNNRTTVFENHTTDVAVHVIINYLPLYFMKYETH